MVERDVIWLGCASGNHAWVLAGGCNAGCDADCICSAPVNICSKCGECDYGVNDEADQVRRLCVREAA